ncbi:MAG TPA: bifunctional hydroxymethylpyrimidine kinase/phosphomethylpyrimidine kinase [Synergistaceae bacterium]|jgi:hydroxymethylpyrimidine/phosphomethylpyrimidine kinase|nr:bifunctional hydroxymethylpyrimidine kinase/phosphomethylpyrimidine kinase [Synergistaceae bacterium]HPX03593.1 bifunctional hydroxymethylpyrimidine kinase/phosphomethylpyrimidine kinase [Synergistaceae bacterium]HQA54762.1 bifunctional hydroxymethylpyrimidine kinase/phosphomethylpyrimidine kinase [Synergistaceae bacterium]
MIRKVLTIAGSDCSGGAGIQADLKTITAFGMYGMSVITALTAQNTTGVYGIAEAGSGFVALQTDAVFEDIRPDAVKIGMVSNSSLILTISEKLKEHSAAHVVVDPVMVSTSGSRLLKQDAVDSLINELIPLAEIITPNLPEAEVLSGITIRDRESMKEAGHIIAERARTNTLIKGGHFGERADDLLVKTDGSEVWFLSERIDNPNTHGTGCTLSSAIACGLAAGASVEESVRAAKDYITDALKSGLDLGSGSGPLDHCCRIRAQILK